VPAGSTIVSGQNTNTIVVNFGTTTGKVGVTAKNACGNRGTTTLSITFNCRESNPALMNVFPNPATDNIELVFAADTDGNSEIQLLDMAGRVMLTKTIPTIAGMNQTSLNLSGYSKGVYMVNLVKNGKTSRVKVVLE
jgi:hypothetical protein